MRPYVSVTVSHVTCFRVQCYAISYQFDRAMAFLTIHTRAILLCLVQLLFTHLARSQCNTDQNPYCRGNSQFEQLCCTYPNVCYWSDRSGTPACCPAGTDCSSDGGPTGGFALNPVQSTTVQTTVLVQTVYTTTQPQYTTVIYTSTSQYQTWQQQTTTTTTTSQWQTWQQQTTTTVVPAPVYTSWSTVTTPNVIVVTATSPAVQPAQTTGVYVTVQAVGNRAPRVIAEDGYLTKVFGAFVFACVMVWSI